MKREDMNTIWMRLGGTLAVTDDELKLLIHSNEDAANALLARLLSQHRFEPGGDTYIPAEAVEAYNQDYETAHPVEEIIFYV